MAITVTGEMRSLLIESGKKMRATLKVKRDEARDLLNAGVDLTVDGVETTELKLDVVAGVVIEEID